MPDDLFQSPYGLGIPRKRGVLPDARLVDEGVHEGVFRQNVQKSIYRLRGLPSEEGIIDQVQAEPSPVDRHGSARLVEMNPAALEKTRKRTRTREHVPDSENPALANGRAAIRVGRDVPEVQQQVVGGEGLPQPLPDIGVRPNLVAAKTQLHISELALIDAQGVEQEPLHPVNGKDAEIDHAYPSVRSQSFVLLNGESSPQRL